MTLSPIKNDKVSKVPLQWHVTYEAVDAAGNFAVPKVRTVEIQVGREHDTCTGMLSLLVYHRL